MKTCNHCGEEANESEGGYMFKKFFCNCCLDYNNVSPEDDLGD